MSDYAEFLLSKSQSANMGGFEPVWMPSFLKPFQSHLVARSIRQGRSAIFADCGLGKTPITLVVAENVVRHTNRPALILAPLAVSHQFVREAEKFGVEAHVSTDGKPRPNITVANYERLPATYGRSAPLRRLDDSRPVLAGRVRCVAAVAGRITWSRQGRGGSPPARIARLSRH